MARPAQRKHSVKRALNAEGADVTCRQLAARLFLLHFDLELHDGSICSDLSRGHCRRDLYECPKGQLTNCMN
jgi:hypothetical protein